ncbi:hypothetical protein CN918_26780 [Priestia megaterium]|nr:hypothetical protein CN918_26780 [Priestia megaterium]
MRGIKYIFVVCICFIVLLFVCPHNTLAPIKPKEREDKIEKNVCTSPLQESSVQNKFYISKNEFNLLVIELGKNGTFNNSFLKIYPSTENKYLTTTLESEQCWRIKENENKGELFFYNASNTKVKGSFLINKNNLSIKLNKGTYLTNTLYFKLAKREEVEAKIKQQQENKVVYPFLNQWETMKKKMYQDELKNGKGDRQIWLKKRNYSNEWLTNQEKVLQAQTKKIIEEGKTVKWLFQRALKNKENALRALHSTQSYEAIVTDENYLQYEQDVTAFTIHYKEYRRQMDILKNQKRALETVLRRGEASQTERDKLKPIITGYNEAIKTLTMPKDMFYKMLGALIQDVAIELETKI